MMLHSNTCGRPALLSSRYATLRPAAIAARKVSSRVAYDNRNFENVALSPLLSKLEAESSKGQVYGKPLTKSEVSALKSTLVHLQNGDSDTSRADTLRSQLLSIMKEAATTKSLPLNIVEGAMVLLEQLYLMDARPKGGELSGVMTPEEMLCRWQLVIGADVGSIQYIPVVEEFEVAPSGTTFALDTDLGVLFTGFSGDSSWLSSGHVRYHVRRVRLELRLPKSLTPWKKESETKKDDGRGTCHPDPSKPAITLPLPFPANELFIFASNGDLGVLRSKLGGLILLVNKTPVAERSRLKTASS